jgi:murein DD-endopeptidase MepM/ murein hydrolase activator NlpD
VPGPIPVAGDFSHPFPTFTGYGYLFWSPVYVGGVKVADHTGIDYIGPEGDPILAAHNGQIVYAEYLSRFTALAVKWWISGNVIVIRGSLEDGTPVCSFYGHGQNGSIIVSPGQNVTAGQQIMSNGSTGFSTAPHLHFAIKVDGNGDFCDGGSWVNPADYIK